MTGETALRRLARRTRARVRALVVVLRLCRNRRELLRALAGRDTGVRAVLRDGTTIAAPEASTLVPLLAEIHIARVYDHERAGVRAGDVVVDIGAHVGVFALHAAALGASAVYAYEPSPLNARFLRGNIESNGVASIVTTVEAAVGASEGRARLGLGRYSVGNVMLDAVDEPAAESVEVRTTTLAGIFAAHAIERIDYLKIDCEGSEGALLAAAAAGGILRRVERIALEYHDNWSSLEHGALAQLLREAGFDVTIERQGDSPFGMIHAWRA